MRMGLNQGNLNVQTKAILSQAGSTLPEGAETTGGV